MVSTHNNCQNVGCEQFFSQLVHVLSWIILHAISLLAMSVILTFSMSIVDSFADYLLASLFL